MKKPILFLVLIWLACPAFSQLPTLKTGHPILLLNNAKLTALQNYYNSRKPLPAAPSSSGTRPLYGSDFPQAQGRLVFDYYPMHYSEDVTNEGFFDSHGSGNIMYIRHSTDSNAYRWRTKTATIQENFGFTLAENEWHHLEIYWDTLANYISIDIDGSLRTYNMTSDWAPSDQKFIFWGNGYYDNIKLYDKVDTTDPSVTQLLWLDFESVYEGYENYLWDRSGQGNHCKVHHQLIRSRNTPSGTGHSLRIMKAHQWLFYHWSERACITTTANVDTTRRGNWMDRSLERLFWKADEITSDGINLSMFAPDVFEPLAMAYKISQEPARKTTLMNHFYAHLRSDHYTGSELYTSARLRMWGLIYDWMYDELTLAERQEIVDTVKSVLNNTTEVAGRRMTRHICGGDAGFTNTTDFECADATAYPDYVVGHPFENNVNLLGALIPLVEDHPELNSALENVYDNFKNGFDSARAWAAIDGALYNSAKYSRFQYMSVLPALYNITAFVNDSTLHTNFRSKIIDRFIYGMQTDLSMPNSSDNVYWSLKEGNNDALIRIALYASVYFGNQQAQWFFENLIEPYLKDGADIYALLYGDTTIVPVSPEGAWPLSKHFRNGAYVYNRSSWDYNTAVTSELICTPFLNDGHQHQDRGSFTLNYGGNLILESGEYETYGSSHFWNYFTRSIAHNTITVYNPAEKYYLNGYPVLGEVSNDGGQIIPQYTSTYHKDKSTDIQPGGDYYVGGIEQFENHADYSYTFLDATRSYDTTKVTCFTRQFVFLRQDDFFDKPVIVILDRVEATDPSFVQKCHFHSQQEPTISGNLSSIDNGAGKAIIRTLLPNSHTNNLVGGLGNEFTVNGTNYPLGAAAQPLHLHDDGIWRMEITAPTGNNQNHFLNVISVHESGTPTTSAPTAHYYQTDSIVAVVLSNSILLTMPKDSMVNSLDSVLLNADTSAYTRVLATGLHPNTTYFIDNTDSLRIWRKMPADPITHTIVTSSDAGTIYYDFTGIPLSRNLIQLNGQIKHRSIALNWAINNTVEIEQYYLERAFDNTAYTVLASEGPVLNNRGSYNDASILNQPDNKRVTYRLRCITNNGQVKYSNYQTFNLNQTTPVVFPVPARNQLTVTCPTKFSVIRVHSLTGTTVQTIRLGNKLNQFTFGLQNIPKGCYIISVDDPTEAINVGRAKFIKN